MKKKEENGREAEFFWKCGDVSLFFFLIRLRLSVVTATGTGLAAGVVKFFFSSSFLPFLLHLVEGSRAGKGEDRSSQLRKMELPRKALCTPRACLVPATRRATR